MQGSAELHLYASLRRARIAHERRALHPSLQHARFLFTHRPIRRRHHARRPAMHNPPHPVRQLHRPSHDCQRNSHRNRNGHHQTQSAQGQFSHRPRDHNTLNYAQAPLQPPVTRGSTFTKHRVKSAHFGGSRLRPANLAFSGLRHPRTCGHGGTPLPGTIEACLFA